ncbi:MAG: hypothetical protein HFJ49_03720 [Clostridia bacterium]|nr:hypothetical protein [Clostridia bacterium]
MQVKKILKYIIFVIIFIIINIILENNVEAVNQWKSEDINGIDNNRYPGVKQMIQMLQYEHPNWKFKVLYTGLTLDEVIANEYVGHGTDSPRSLVSASLQGEWKCAICGDTRYDNGSWCCASEIALRYMIDPRNSINSSDVFQFMELTYVDCDYNSIQQMVSGTFLDNYDYIQAILRAAWNNNLSAYYLAALALQEQGQWGGGTVSGTYPGYEGYYNIFNINATGKGSDVIIQNGLSYAKNKGWDSLVKSIEGGAEKIADGYIKKGQNTIYFKKFDVDNSDGNLYWHQYQQNILAAQNEGVKIRKALEETGKMEAQYTFVIPLYENTPLEICKKPNTSSSSGTITSDLVRVNVNSTISVRSSPNGPKISGVLLRKDEIVTRLQKATEKVGGTYWDYIMKADGTKCYVARETYDYDSPYKLYLIPLSEEQPQPPEDETNIIKNDKVKVNYTSKKITIVPGTTIQDIIALTGENIVVKNGYGQIVEEGIPLGTGCTVNDTYVIAVLGDANGDAKINSGDLFNVQKYLLTQYGLSEHVRIAMDANGDGKINSGDLFVIQKYLLVNSGFIIK